MMEGMRLHTYRAQDPKLNCDLDVFHRDAAEAARQLEAEDIGRSMNWGSPQKHPPESPENEHVSKWSDRWWALMRDEWYSIDLNTDFSGAERDTHQTPETRYHGTEWGSAWQVLVESQGFIPGEGTHAKKSKSYSGMFCTETLPDAFQRAWPDRCAREGQYSRWCTPVCLEVKTAHLVKVGPTKYVKPGTPGKQLNGIEFVRLHFHLPMMDNYMRLERREIREILRTEWNAVMCACKLCGRVTHRDCNTFWHWVRSGKHYWYHRSCHTRVSNSGRNWLR